MSVKKRNAYRSGMSLIEIISALIIAATVIAVGMQHLRPVDRRSKDRSCELTRKLLQNDIDRYVDSTGSTVSSNLQEVAVDDYSGNPLPVCPVSGDAFRLNRAGHVHCVAHP